MLKSIFNLNNNKVGDRSFPMFLGFLRGVVVCNSRIKYTERGIALITHMGSSIFDYL